MYVSNFKKLGNQEYKNNGNIHMKILRETLEIHPRSLNTIFVFPLLFLPFVYVLYRFLSIYNIIYIKTCLRQDNNVCFKK